MATPPLSSDGEALVLDGRAVADRVRREVAAGVASFREKEGRAPGLATVLIGDDPASAGYVANKRKACEEAGMRSFHNLEHHYGRSDTTLGFPVRRCLPPRGLNP